MIKVGVTGGIGSGKTTICRIFEILAVPVYYADDRARFLTDTSEDIKAAIISQFGENVFCNGVLDRVKLGRIVFQDKKKLNGLNAIIHPVVANDFLSWSKKHSSRPFVIKEAAILFESGQYKQMDKLITVTAPEILRIQRVMDRDGLDETLISQRIKNQWGDKRKVDLSDYEIKANDLELVIPQVITIYNHILNQIE